jgi:hypothetical protein
MSQVKLGAAAPVLAAPDVGATATWYAEHLGFRATLFGEAARPQFAILARDGVEIMLRRCGVPLRARADWDVYVRMAGVDALHEQLRATLPIVEPLVTKGHHCREFAIEDPNGYRIVFSEAL